MTVLSLTNAIGGALFGMTLGCIIGVALVAAAAYIETHLHRR